MRIEGPPERAGEIPGRPHADSARPDSQFMLLDASAWALAAGALGCAGAGLHGSLLAFAGAAALLTASAVAAGAASDRCLRKIVNERRANALATTVYALGARFSRRAEAGKCLRQLCGTPQVEEAAAGPALDAAICRTLARLSGAHFWVSAAWWKEREETALLLIGLLSADLPAARREQLARIADTTPIECVYAALSCKVGAPSADEAPQCLNHAVDRSTLAAVRALARPDPEARGIAGASLDTLPPAEFSKLVAAFQRLERAHDYDIWRQGPRRVAAGIPAVAAAAFVIYCVEAALLTVYVVVGYFGGDLVRQAMGALSVPTDIFPAMLYGPPVLAVLHVATLPHRFAPGRMRSFILRQSPVDTRYAAIGWSAYRQYVASTRDARRLSSLIDALSFGVGSMREANQPDLPPIRSAVTVMLSDLDLETGWALGVRQRVQLRHHIASGAKLLVSEQIRDDEKAANEAYIGSAISALSRIGDSGAALSIRGLLKSLEGKAGVDDLRAVAEAALAHLATMQTGTELLRESTAPRQTAHLLVPATEGSPTERAQMLRAGDASQAGNVIVPVSEERPTETVQMLRSGEAPEVGR